jgi:hypothetical protein
VYAARVTESVLVQLAFSSACSRHLYLSAFDSIPLRSRPLSWESHSPLVV